MSGIAGEKPLMLLFLLAGIILILDQSSKFMICRAMTLNESIPVVRNVFHLTYIQNKGAAFGLFPCQTLFFIIVTLLVISLIIFFYKRMSGNRVLMSWALGFILGGAVGNLIDRIRLQAVIDFLDFRIWPVFNLADSAITVGAIILFSSILLQKGE
jgi:signal peptidase II